MTHPFWNIYVFRGTGTCLILHDSTARVDVQAKGTESSRRVVTPVPNLTVSSNRSKRPVCSEQAAHALQLAAAQFTVHRFTLSLRPLFTGERLAFAAIRGVAPSQARRRPTKDSLCSHTLFIAVVHKGVVHACMLEPCDRQPGPSEYDYSQLQC